MANSPEFTGSGVESEGAIAKWVGEIFLDKEVLEMPEEDLGAILRAAGDEVKECITKNGEYDRNALLRKLSVGQKIEILIGHWMDNLFGNFVEEQAAGKKYDFEVMSFEDEKQRVLAEDSGVLVDGENIILPTGSLLGNFASARYLADLFKQAGGGGIESDEKVRLPAGSRIVLGALAEEPGDGAYLGSGFARLRALSKQTGLKLTRVSPGRTLTEPGEKELQLVYTDGDSLPMKADGKVDIKALRWYKEMFDDGVGTTWVKSAEILVGVYMLKGLDKESALTKAAYKSPKPDLLVRVNKLEQQLKPAASAAPAEDADA